MKTPPTIAVFVDTNVYIRVLTQGKKGCEIEHLRKLKELVDSKSVTLLVPEVVVLEFSKVADTVTDSYKSNFKKLKEGFANWTKSSTWNEMDGIKEALRSDLDARELKEIESAEAYKAEVNLLLASPNVIKIPLTLSTLLEAKRRLIGGKMASPERRSEADALLVESLVEFLKANPKYNQLLFCSENVSDFGVKVASGDAALHPAISDGFPAAELFTDLASLIKFHESRQPVVEPDPKEIKEAIARESARSAKVKDHFADYWLSSALRRPWQHGFSSAFSGGFAKGGDQDYLLALPFEIGPGSNIADEIKRRILISHLISEICTSPAVMHILADAIEKAATEEDIDRLLAEFVRSYQKGKDTGSSGTTAPERPNADGPS